MIDSGVEVETVSILVNKKPFLDALNAQGMDSINPSEQQNPQAPHTLEDQEKNEYDRVVVVEEGILHLYICAFPNSPHTCSK